MSTSCSRIVRVSSTPPVFHACLVLHANTKIFFFYYVETRVKITRETCRETYAGAKRLSTGTRADATNRERRGIGSRL